MNIHDLLLQSFQHTPSLQLIARGYQILKWQIKFISTIFYDLTVDYQLNILKFMTALYFIY